MIAQSRFQTNDTLQRSVAAVSTGILQRKCDCGNHTVAGGKCDECQNKTGVLQRKSSNNFESPEVPPIVHEVLNSSGRPLDESTRAFFEPRFAHNFSRVPVSSASRQLSPSRLTIGESKDVYEQEADRVADSVMQNERSENKTLSTNEDAKLDLSDVRIHTDARAAESARAVNALAYTVGNNIVFGAGQFAARTREGRRLLAHELTHVVQQSSGKTSALQRDEPEQGTAPIERIDVALVLDDDPTSMIEAGSYASTVIRATSGADAKAKLIALGKPIGKIFVVSHSNAIGEVHLVSPPFDDWVSLSDFSKALKGLPVDIAPLEIDFRGCKMGEAPQEMEAFRQNIGAQSARGIDCWNMERTSQPLMMPDEVTPITQESQIKGIEKAFNKALRKKINSLKSANKKSVKNCIVGLAAGETAKGNFEKIKRLYFENKGHLLASWASQEFDHIWREGLSICVKDLTATTKPCKIVTQTAPAAPAPAGGAKTGAMLIEPVESSPVDWWSESETEADAWT
jgi:hypothetical protein